MSRNRSAVPNLVWDEDVKGLLELSDNLKIMANNHIEYGILHNEEYPAGDARAGIYVAQIAMEHETGLADQNMPARPFFTQSVNSLVSWVQ